MKNYHILSLFLAVASLGWAQGAAPSPAPVASAGTDLPVSGWCVVGSKDTKFGPTEEGGKVVFGGEGFGAKGRNLAAYFPATELGEGQTLELKGTVRLMGVAGTGNFRYGLFKKRSRDHSRGWLGYCAYAGFDKAFPSGALLARLKDNDADFSGMKGAKGNCLQSLVPRFHVTPGALGLNRTDQRADFGDRCGWNFGWLSFHGVVPAASGLIFQSLAEEADEGMDLGSRNTTTQQRTGHAEPVVGLGGGIRLERGC